MNINHKDYWRELLRRLEPYLEEKGKMSRLAEYLDVPRQHVFKWVREGMGPNYNYGKRIEEWIEKQ